MSQAGILRVTSGGGGGGTGILTITGNSGGTVPADAGNNLNLLGSGAITVTGSPGTNTLTISTTFPFFMWTTVSANQPAVTQNGYFVDGPSRVELSLPASSAVGDVFSVVDIGGQGWRITQGGGQQIRVLTSTTTSGAGGYIESIFIGDGATLICSSVDTEWIVFPPQASLTIV